MILGYQITTDATGDRAEAEVLAESLRKQDGCIRAAVKDNYPHGWYAYGVFAGGVDRSAMPDGVRRVVLCGQDANRAVAWFGAVPSSCGFDGGDGIG